MQGITCSCDIPIDSAKHPSSVGGWRCQAQGSAALSLEIITLLLCHSKDHTAPHGTPRSDRYSAWLCSRAMALIEQIFLHQCFKKSSPKSPGKPEPKSPSYASGKHPTASYKSQKLTGKDNKTATNLGLTVSSFFPHSSRRWHKACGVC